MRAATAEDLEPAVVTGLTATLIMDVLAEPRSFTAAIIEGDLPSVPERGTMGE